MKRNFILILFSLAALFMTSSCTLTIKPAATKSAKAFYESFFTEEGTMYFIKPIEFEDNTKNKLFIDFTFRHKKELADTAVVNISIENDDILKTVDHITLSNSDLSVSLTEVSLLFNERSKNKKFTSRFSGKCLTKDLINIMGDTNAQIEISSQESSAAMLFLPNKNSQKTIRSLNDFLYILF